VYKWPALQRAVAYYDQLVSEAESAASAGGVKGEEATMMLGAMKNMAHHAVLHRDVIAKWVGQGRWVEGWRKLARRELQCGLGLLREAQIVILSTNTPGELVNLGTTTIYLLS
jgi:hypothetical protein